jgi:signal transduction histidine kinase
MASSDPEARGTILVVDDNEENRLVAEGHLVSAGYEVVMAPGGEEALRLFASRAPDLVLLDIMMPGMDGFETCRRLRELPGGRDTPIVYLTALADLDTHARAQGTAADDFLTKPIRRVELLIRVRSLVRLKRLQVELERTNEPAMVCWHALEHCKRLQVELERTNELVRAQRDALARAQEQKRRLTAMIVHDLKNPLAAMMGNGSFLLDAEIGTDERAAVADIVASADAMHRMVLDVLDVDRSEDGALVVRRETVRVRDLLEACAQAARRRELGAGHDVAVVVAPGAGALEADPDLLRRVLDNLLDNCAKYPPKGTTIQLAAEPEGDGAIVLRVADHGPGIPQDQREAVFEPYARLERDRNAHARTSRGLGLAFCKLAAAAHGGTIWVQDNVPQGTVFCLRMPGHVRD